MIHNEKEKSVGFIGAGKLDMQVASTIHCLKLTDNCYVEIILLLSLCLKDDFILKNVHKSDRCKFMKLTRGSVHKIC